MFITAIQRFQMLQLQFIPDAIIEDVILFLVYAVAKLGPGVNGGLFFTFFFIHLTPTQCM